jgi:hypothetical protein
MWAADGSIVFPHREGPLGPFCRYHVWGKHRIWRISRDRTSRRRVTLRVKPAVIDDGLPSWRR